MNYGIEMIIFIMGCPCVHFCSFECKINNNLSYYWMLKLFMNCHSIKIENSKTEFHIYIYIIRNEIEAGDLCGCHIKQCLSIWHIQWDASINVLNVCLFIEVALMDGRNCNVECTQYQVDIFNAHREQWTEWGEVRQSMVTRGCMPIIQYS